jgi:hypothetical protein
MCNQKTFTIFMRRVFYFRRFSRWRLDTILVGRITAIARMDTVNW